MPTNQGGYKIIANSSYMSSGDQSFDSTWSSPAVTQTRRDVFDITVWKLHSLNRPTKRDSSLRKSVLIFNLLRCLQRDDAFNAADDVDMVSDTMTTLNQESNIGADSYNDEEEDEEMVDDDLTDESDTSGSSDSETKSAVISLAMLESEEEKSDLHSNVNVTFQFSSVTGSSWSSVSCGTAEPEIMDVDTRNDLSSFVGLQTRVSDNSHQRDDGLITESYRLLESGPCLIGDQNYHFGQSKSYGGVAVDGEFRPFDTAGGYNLFA